MKTLFDVHMKRSIEQVGEVVQLGNGGAALRDTSGSVMNSGLDIAADLLLLFNLSYRQLLCISGYSGERVLVVTYLVVLIHFATDELEWWSSLEVFEHVVQKALLQQLLTWPTEAVHESLDHLIVRPPSKQDFASPQLVHGTADSPHVHWIAYVHAQNDLGCTVEPTDQVFGAFDNISLIDSGTKISELDGLLVCRYENIVRLQIQMDDLTVL